MPIQSKADLTLDGSRITGEIVRQLLNTLSSVLDLDILAKLPDQ